jgi:LCP family protein required for cell wall assembly
VLLLIKRIPLGGLKILSMKKTIKNRVLLISIACLFVLGGIGLCYTWQNSLLGQKLESPPTKTQTPPADTPNAKNRTATLSDSDPTPDEQAVVATFTPGGPQPTCKGPDSMNVLVLGIDEHAQADAIRLVHIDFVTPAVTDLTIPRGLYVPIIDMAEQGITQGRINATYGYGEHFNGIGEGVHSLAENLHHNFDISVDHYIVVQFSTVAEMIDQVGGVTIHLDKPLDGRLQNMGYYAAGDHPMDGETALDFMRIRYPDTDFHRMRRQTQLVKALLKKVREELNILQQTRLALTLLTTRGVRTSLSPQDLQSLICLGRSLPKGAIHFVEIPPDLYYSTIISSGANVQLPQIGFVDFVQAVMAGDYQAVEGE